MKPTSILLPLLFCLFDCAVLAKVPEPAIEWTDDLPALPQPLSGHFVGVSNGALLVGGGSNFPVSLFEGGTKVWYRDIYALAPNSSAWKKVGAFENPLAYACAVTTEEGIFIAGGSDGETHSKQAFLLSLDGETVERTNLPDLPTTLAYAGSAAIGETVYIAGGRETPEATETLGTFYSLDLSNPEEGWTSLEPWPGTSCMLPVMAAQGGVVYLFGGTTLVPDPTSPEGGSKRKYLTHGFRYRPGEGWSDAQNPPAPLVAAASLPMGQSHLFAFGGDDGELVDRIQELKDNHPGFPKTVYAYHTLTDTWTEFGTFPEGFVTTQSVEWEGRVVIPGGEDRPGHRGDRVLSGTVVENRRGFDPIDYAAIVVYLAILLGIGFYFARRGQTSEDFFLAGQRIPWWAAGLSIFGTQLSAITFLAIPAKTFAEDWVIFFVNMTIILIAPLVVFFYLPFYRQLGITTVYEFLEIRFNLAARLFGASIFILFQMGRMGIVLYLPALALTAATGVDIYRCILLMGVLATLYTALGGIEAVIWTDVAQVFVLVGGALVSLVLILLQTEGGLAGAIETASEANKFHMFNPGWSASLPVIWVVLVGQSCANIVPYTSDQTVVQRYLTTSDEGKARRAIWTNAAMTLPASLLFCGVGTALYVFYKTNPEALSPTLQTDAIFPLFIVQQLPFGLSGLVVAGIFAASMSSLDSSLNSLSTVIVTDFRQRLGGKMEGRKALTLARVLTVLFGVVGTSVAIALATFDVKSLMDLYIGLLGLVGGSMAGLFALGVFTKRTGGTGALVGAVCGVVAVTFAKNQTAMPIHFFLNATVSMGVCFVVGYAVSRLIGEQAKPSTIGGYNPR